MPRVPSAPHALGLLVRRVSAARVSAARACASGAAAVRRVPRGGLTALVAVLLLAVGLGAGPGARAVAPPVGATSEGAPQVVELAAAPVVPSRSPTPSVRPTSSPAPRPVPRWLPTGTGMWLHDWRASEEGHALEVVAEAQQAGLTHLFVQTGSSRKGWIGTPVLSQLLPATAGTDLKVVAWDFPKLVHPAADAHRLARAALFRRPGAPRVAAVAPDVETASEGTHVSAASIERYYRTLRDALPDDVAIIATVPWPSEHRVNTYPYARTSRYADAFAPMAYWYNRDPATVTTTSVRFLHKYGKPVLPVGQGYDGRLDAPYLAADPAPDRSVQAFVEAARREDVQAVSLWSWQTTGALQWRVLAEAAGFPSPPPVTVFAPLATPSVSPTPVPTVTAEPLPAPVPLPVVGPSAPGLPLAPAPTPTGTPAEPVPGEGDVATSSPSAAP